MTGDIQQSDQGEMTVMPLAVKVGESYKFMSQASDMPVDHSVTFVPTGTGMSDFMVTLAAGAVFDHAPIWAMSHGR